MTPRKITFLAAALSALFLLLLEPAAAENRLALVIGNNNYVHINKLTRAANDARAVGKVLATLGFSVTTGVDLDSKTLRREVRDFGRKIEAGDIAFLFYAGHGFAVGSDTFVIPTDLVAGGRDAAQIQDDSMAESDILAALSEHKPRVLAMVFDTNRNNPFPARTRPITAGTAKVSGAGATFILYSTGLGQTCLDGLSGKDPSPNSVFTRIFLTELARRNANLLEIALAVRAKVAALAATVNQQQNPAFYDNLTGLSRLAAETQTKGDATAK